VLLVADCDGERPASEARIVRQALAPLEQSRLVDVHEVGAAFDGASPSRDPDPLSAVASGRFDIVQLFCGARRDSSTTWFELANGRVPLQSFAKAVREASPCMVVWNGGSSAADVGSELARSLLDDVPALVIHRGANPRELLGAHTASFYRAIAAMKPADEALATARSAVLSQAPGDGEWIPPSLCLSRKDASVLYNPARPGVSDVYQISEGRYRRALRESLNRFWPKPERYFPQRIQWIPRSAPLSSYALDGEFLSKPQTMEELSNRFQQLVLLGEGGSGKTMALFRLFYEHAQPILAYERKSPLPVYVSLPDLAEGGDLFDLLGAGFDPELFRSDLEEGRFLFLLDSLDGLSASGAAQRVQAVNDFLRRYPLNRFVIASRRPAVAPVDVPSWVEILPFAEWEAIEYLIANDTIRPEAARPLYRQLVSDLGGQRAANPQILAMARRLWREGASVPRSATEIFTAFFRLAGSSIAPDTRDGLLPQLAVFMSRGDRLSLTREYLEARTEAKGLEALARELAARTAGVRSASALLSEVEKTRLLRGPRAFTFPNICFQEFLTAYALRSAAPNTILALVPPADYRDPEGEDSSGRPVNLSLGPFHGALPFLCGLREDGAELVAELCQRDIVLASQSVREARGARNVLNVLHESISRTLGSGESIQERVAVLALESLADPKAISMLEQVAVRSGSSGRAVALEALGSLRSYRSVGVLETAMEDSDPTVAKAALGALTRIQAS
jgi:hypothetical protein